MTAFLLTLLERLSPAALFQSRYHPERHYMRGPGPACARRGKPH